MKITNKLKRDTVHARKNVFNGVDFVILCSDEVYKEICADYRTLLLTDSFGDLSANFVGCFCYKLDMGENIVKYCLMQEENYVSVINEARRNAETGL